MNKRTKQHLRNYSTYLRNHRVAPSDAQLENYCQHISVSSYEKHKQDVKRRDDNPSKKDIVKEEAVANAYGKAITANCEAIAKDSNKEATKEIVSPKLDTYITSTPGAFEKALAEAYANSGFANDDMDYKEEPEDTPF